MVFAAKPGTLDVVKVVMKGTVTSFRYPHFVQGVQPTYEIPPPSTIYGLICAATGQLEPPDELRFGLHFTYEAKFRDLEHIHLGTPYLQANPFLRELLYNPTLTLYIAPVRYLEAFQAPYYPVALGRSQDLMSYARLPKLVALQQATHAYFEHTLLPFSYAPRFQRTVAVTMARFIDSSRRPQWGSYSILKERSGYPDENDPSRATYEPIWVDPEEMLGDGSARGVVLHRFVE